MTPRKALTRSKSMEGDNERRAPTSRPFNREPSRLPHTEPPTANVNDIETRVPVWGQVPQAGELRALRVGKALKPGAPGTVRLSRHYGPVLMLVRYRYDWTGLYRYTTVELLVEAATVARGHRLNSLYAIRLTRHEKHLQNDIRRLGGYWDAEMRRWILPGHAVQALSLAHRVEYVHVVRHASGHDAGKK